MRLLAPKNLLLESIKIDNAKVHNLNYHQKRFDSSRKALFGCKSSLPLAPYINAPSNGLYKCRILYTKTIHSIEYIPYKPKDISSLKIVSSNLCYDFKYANRKKLDILLHTSPYTDEVIIEKDGYLTDTTISNIAFYDGEQWLTPAKPLLKGVMLQKLLDDGFLYTENITSSNLKSYSQVALINAMLGFKILKNINPRDIKGCSL